MNRPLTALFAALEALLVIGVGIGIPLVPLTLMWAFQYGLQLDWVLFWRAAVDTWLLGHGVDLTLTLDPALAASLGLPGAGDAVVATIALLGFSLITVLLAIRAGRRIGETPHGVTGLLVSIVVVALLSCLVALSATHSLAAPSLAQAVLLPTVVYALGVGIGFWLDRRTADAPQRLARWIDGLAGGLRPMLTFCLVGGVVSTFLILAVSALALAATVGVHYGDIIAIYEGVQSGVLGGAMLTVVQLALLPNLVIWTASYLIGPGFAIGTGSAVSPLGTLLGPVPALPVLGALPSGDWPYAFVGLLVPVLAGFLAAIVLRPRLVRARLDGPWWLVGAGLGMGLAGGIVLALLAWASAGSAGPGRLVDVGPAFLAVGGYAALEIGIAAVIALFVAGIRRSGEADVPAEEPATPPSSAPVPGPSTRGSATVGTAARARAVAAGTTTRARDAALGTATRAKDAAAGTATRARAGIAEVLGRAKGRLPTRTADPVQSLRDADTAPIPVIRSSGPSSDSGPGRDDHAGRR